MSRGFDLIRRHLSGRKDTEHGKASPQQGSDGPDGDQLRAPEEVGNASSNRTPDHGRAAPPPPPPFNPVRVAATPPPKPAPRPAPKPIPALPAVPAPSQTLRHKQLPKTLRPRPSGPEKPAARAAQPALQPMGPTRQEILSTAVTSANEANVKIAATPLAPTEPAQANIAQAPKITIPPKIAGPQTPEPQTQPPARIATGAEPRQQSPSRTATLNASRIDNSHARAARRHSVFVALMKGLLPGLVIGLVGVFFFYSYDFRSDILPDNIKFDPGEVSISTDGIRMVAPKLTGVDDKQQTFEIKADEAVQDRVDRAKVTLLGIDARVNLKDGGTIGFSARKGVYNTDLNQIWLKDDLEIRSSEGYVAQLSEAQVDFKNGLMVSNSPVLIFTNDGVISASGVQVLDGGKKVLFAGRVVLNLNGSAGETQ